MRVLGSKYKTSNTVALVHPFSNDSFLPILFIPLNLACFSIGIRKVSPPSPIYIEILQYQGPIYSSFFLLSSLLRFFSNFFTVFENTFDATPRLCLTPNV